MSWLPQRLAAILRRHRRTIADALAFLPGFVGALGILVIARIAGHSLPHYPTMRLTTEIMLPIFCGIISLVLLRGKSRQFDLAETFDRVRQVQQYLMVALAGLILGAFLYFILSVVLVSIIY